MRLRVGDLVEEESFVFNVSGVAILVPIRMLKTESGHFVMTT
jgi:hypothetical protein